MIWQGCQKQLFNVIEEMTAERNENTSEVKLDIFEVLTLIIYSYIHIFDRKNKKHLWGRVGYI